MFKKIAAALIIGVAAVLAQAKPDREEPKKKEELKIPDLRGLTNWGLIEQEGRSITITGHPMWSAVGEITKSGKVRVVWELNSDGRRAPGYYEINEDGDLEGHWNYGDAVEVGKDGELIGQGLYDKVYKMREIN